MDLSQLLPILLGAQQQKQPQASGYDALALLTGKAGQAAPLQSPAMPAPSIAPQPQPLPASPVVPQPMQQPAAPAKSGMDGILDLLKDKDVARSLLAAGTSQLSGDSINQSFNKGFGTYDALQARKAGAKQKAFDNDLATQEANNKALTARSGAHKDAAQATLYGEQANTQASIREKNKAESIKAIADARKAVAAATKAGVETEQLAAANIPLMQEVAAGLGYTDEEAESGAYLEDAEFLKTYNAQVPAHSKIWNKFDTGEKKQYMDAITKEDGPLYEMSADQIKATIDTQDIYRPNDAKALYKYIDTMVKRRDKKLEKAQRKSLRDDPSYSRTDKSFDTWGVD